MIDGLKEYLLPDYVFNYSYPREAERIQQAAHARGMLLASVRIFKELIARKNLIICDRFHLSEYAYGPVKRYYPKWLAEKVMLDVENELYKQLGLGNVKQIILAFLDPELIRGRLKKDDYPSFKEAVKINARYKEALTYSELPTRLFYTDRVGKQATLEKALKWTDKEGSR